LGADLYISNAYEIKEKWAKLAKPASLEDGYFRDCYNEAGLFAFIRANTRYKELSWWGDILPNLNKKHMLTVTYIKSLLKKIELAQKDIDNKEILIMHETIYPENWTPGTELIKKETILNKEQIKEYKNWLNHFEAFLNVAIDNKSTIECSL
jgi:hypothetical protein